MILSLLIYGSRARGDHRAKSDVDLLAIIDNGPLRSESFTGGASLYQYPLDLLMKRARAGDLFVLHLKQEAKIIHDTAGIFKIVKQEFKLREDYSKEIADAYCVIRFFFTRRKLLTKTSARKRLIWAIRTILIARSAEEQDPKFSSSALSSFGGISDIKPVIDNRNQTDFEKMRSVARRVAHKFAEDRVDFAWPSIPSEQRKFMASRGGIVADTLKFIQPRSLAKKLRVAAIEEAKVPESDYFVDMTID